MKQAQKIFLLIWIPIMIIVIGGMIGNHGITAKSTRVEGLVYTIGWSDTIPVIVIAICITMLFTWMAGVDEIDIMKTKLKR